MNRLFNLDNPVFQFLNKVADVMIINLFFLILCIPVVTIGPATSAMYYVTLKHVRGEEGYVTRDFFHSFKSNLKQGILMTIGAIVLGLILGLDIQFFRSMGTTMGNVLFMFFVVMTVFFVVILTYLFPILAKFDNTTKRLLLNAFVLSIRHFPSTIIILLTTVAGALALYIAPVSIFIIFGAVAYLNSYFFARIFDKYVPQEDKEPEKDDLTQIRELSDSLERRKK